MEKGAHPRRRWRTNRILIKFAFRHAGIRVRLRETFIRAACQSDQSNGCEETYSFARDNKELNVS